MQQQPFTIDALYFYALICYFANSLSRSVTEQKIYTAAS